jgi:hypothetical protein
MPNVPVYSTTQVAPSNLPDARQQTPRRLLQANELGPMEQQRLGQSLVSTGVEGLNMATMEQIQQNETAAKQFDVDHVTANDAILHGSTDAQGNHIPGYLDLKGAQAADPKVVADTEAKLRAVPQDLTQSLDNTAQQKLVAQTQQLRTQAALNMMNNHRARQLEVAETTASQLRVTAGAASATKGFNFGADTPTLITDQADPNYNSAYQQGLRTVASETRSLSAGLPQDAQDAAVKQALSGVYAQTVAYMLNGPKGAAGDPGSLATARTYYNSVKDHLSPQQIEKIEPVLNAANTQDSIVTVTRALLNGGKPDDFTGMLKTLGDAFDNRAGGAKIGGQVVDGTVYQHVKSAIEKARNEYATQQDQNTASILGQAQDFFIKNPGKTVQDLPRPIYTGLMLKGQLAAADSFANREGIVKTNPAVFLNVTNHMGDGSPLDPAKLSETDWMAMRAVIAPKQWEEWSKERDAYKSGTPPAASKDPGNVQTAAFNATFNSRVLSMQMNPAPKDDAGKQQLGAMKQFANEWLIQEQQIAGKRFNQEEIGKSLDKLFATNIGFRNSFLGIPTGTSSQRMMMMSPKDIPGDAYDGIRQDLIRSGNTNPTDRDIQLQYWRLHGRH